MDDKNMREISMDEMDRVSGGSGENPPNNTGACPYCGYRDITRIHRCSDGRVRYKCNRCECVWEK